MYSFNTLRVCFIGIGSIASKHIKSLKEIAEEQKIRIRIDALRQKRNLIKEPYEEALKQVEKVYYSYEELPSDYDAVFITNPTDLHLDSLTKAWDKTDRFFIEKPITSLRNAKEVKNIRTDSEKLLYVAAPMRCTEVVRYLKNSLDPSEVIGVRCYCSSYLPEWRPGTDYRKCYSAVKALGGGVSIDLIHEWDYLTYLFGFPDRVLCMLTKKSSLEMDVEDCAAYLAEYRDKTIELHLDYYGRESRREIMLFTSEDTIVCDFLRNRIDYLKSGKSVQFNSAPDSEEKEEMYHFLDIIDNRTENDNDPMNAYRTLLLTQGELVEAEG